MRPLWALLVATLVLLVVLAVGGATSIFYVHFPQRLEAELQREFEGDIERMREVLAETDRVLDALLDKATGRAGSNTSAAQTAPWLWARELLPRPDAQLKVLGSEGRVLSSGHWPSSTGRSTPATEHTKKLDQAAPLSWNPSRLARRSLSSGGGAAAGMVAPLSLWPDCPWVNQRWSDSESSNG